MGRRCWTKKLFGRDARGRIEAARGREQLGRFVKIRPTQEVNHALPYRARRCTANPMV